MEGGTNGDAGPQGEPVTDLANAITRWLVFLLADILAGIALGRMPRLGAAWDACYGDGVL
jgi:hypothetical protein